MLLLKTIVSQINESHKCQARCRDGTACLNNARFKGYCWKHKPTPESSKLMP
ncbi:MAG: hypothetical protein AB1668_03025 [Nanoarchaeota archaeon]